MFVNEDATINNVAGGLAPEIFLKKLRECIENSYDPTTPEGAANEVTLTFKVKPVIDPNMGQRREQRIKTFSISCTGKSKVAKVETISHEMCIDYTNEGFPKLVKFDPSQVDIFQQMAEKQQQSKEEINNG